MPERKTDRHPDRRYQRAQKRWTEEELEYLGNKYGLVSERAICRHLQRSPDACRIIAIRKLHSNRKMNFYCGRELARALGVPDSKTIMNWALAGWIPVRKSVVKAGKFRAWLFRDKNIVKFLREKPWLFDLAKMPEHYFRTIVREEYERDPWYNCEQAAPLLGVKTDDAVQRYIRHGWLPAVKKPGGPWQGVWIIRRSAILSFLANDPRRQYKIELASATQREIRRKNGQPIRISVFWAVLCPECGQTVLVKAEPQLLGREVLHLFTEIHTNGRCSHGLICALGKEATVTTIL